MAQRSGRTRMVIVDDWITAMAIRDAWRREGLLSTISRRGSAIYGGQPRFRVRGRYTRLLDGSKPYRVRLNGPLGTTTVETGKLDAFGEPIEEVKSCRTYTYSSDRWLVPDSNPPAFKRLGAEMPTPAVEAYTQQIITDAEDAQRAAVESREKKEGE